MKTYISILRGINVSGKNQLKMDALRQLYVSLKFSNVKSYIQSGNIIFQSAETNCKKLEVAICKKIFVDYGMQVPVLVLTLGELKAIIERNPFSADKTKNPYFFHITFLSDNFAKTDFEAIKVINYSPDEFNGIEKAIYLYCPLGYGNTKLSTTFWEKKLNVRATTRNWKTANELVKMGDSLLE